uniref:Replication protein A 70 kDa DNA-binding subunit B/D first OB fold domain-containing protein n=1 Tax=Lactuca sativa TaxID=4236 RepID=A0A9R1V192_LACSA|nr:hypothetical protein LSAT_V11C700379820 [Lactuca sativa]
MEGTFGYSIDIMFSIIMTMADINITLIKDFDNIKDDYTLKVSIIWLWRSLSDDNPTIVKSIEMILMDEMCTKIRASVYPRDFQRFESKLKEDQVVYIRSPTIAPNRYIFKISDVTSKLNLHGRTTVNECLHFQSKTTYGFSYIIGEVDSLGKLDSHDVSKSLHRLPLQIINLEGLQVNMTLLEILHTRTPSVNNYFEQTRMFINANLPEIVTFTDSSQSYSDSDDFLNNYKVKNVVDLIEPQEVGQYIIVGTIYGIRQDIDWYYDACTNCGKKVEIRDVLSGPHSGDASVVVKCYGDKCINKKISSFPRFFTLKKISNEQLKEFY